MEKNHLRKTALLSAAFLALPVMLQVAEGASILAANRFDSATGTQEYVHVNRSTGAITKVGPGVSGTPLISNMATGYGAGGFYSIVAQPTSQPSRLYSFDAATGAIISNPGVSAPVNGLRYDSSGNILGLRFSSGTEDLVSINPGTGIVSTIGAGIPNFSSFFGQAAYDPVNKVYSFHGSLNDSMGARIFTVDATNGNLLSSPLFSPPSGVSFWNYDNTGRILGLRFDSGTERLVSINPSTAVVLDIGPGIPNFGFITGDASYDPMDNVYTFPGNRTSEGKRLFSLNATTGAIVSEPFQPDFLNGMTYLAPEPSGLLLAACSALLALRRGRRRG